jgi:deoxyribose-phosphate aldolase
MVDLTTLEGKDTPGKVASLCQKALTPHDDGRLPAGRRGLRVSRDGEARPPRARRHTAVKIASVATAFPSGQAPLKTRGSPR